MNRISIGVVLLAATCSLPQPVFAADDPPRSQAPDGAVVDDAAPAPAAAVEMAAAAPKQVFITASLVREGVPNLASAKRPPMLSKMYATWLGLQAYDAYSTLAGVSGGATEANPFVNGLTRNRAMFFAAKASMTAVTIGVAEQMWRDHHPGRAIALMVVSNGVMAVVAARNAAVLHELR
jgi:hypothetical protein